MSSSLTSGHGSEALDDGNVGYLGLRQARQRPKQMSRLARSDTQSHLSASEYQTNQIPTVLVIASFPQNPAQVSAEVSKSALT